MVEETTIIAIVAILVSLSVPFILRALNKGEKNVVTTTNYYNLNKNVEDLEKKVDKNQEELVARLNSICNEHDRDQRETNKAFAEIGGNMKVHTNQIADMIIQLSRFDERLRLAEVNIIRNERRLNSNGA